MNYYDDERDNEDYDVSEEELNDWLKECEEMNPGSTGYSTQFD